MADPTRLSTLRAGSIGLPGVVFQAITTMAPAGAVALSLAPAVPHAGPALPLSVAIALVVCFLVALNIATLARHLPSAGGHFTYVSRGLGPRAGWMVGWTLGFSYLVTVPGVFLAFAVFTDGFIKAVFDVSFGPHGWLVYVFALAASTFALTFFGIRISAIAGIVLGTIEIAIFAALAIWIIVAAGADNTLAVFNPGSSPKGWQGVMSGMLFVFTAFAGFESAASFGEESRDPHRIVPRSILLATLGIGAFILLCSYAAVVGWGVGEMSTYANDLSPWATMATRAWGRLGVLAGLAILNSGFGGAIAVVNAGARLLYAMARIALLPRLLGRTSRYDTPSAIAPMVLLGVVVASSAGLVYGPMTGFALLGAISTVPLLLVYIAVCVSVPFYYLREHRQEFRLGRHMLLPIAPVLLIAAVIYLQLVPLPAAPFHMVGSINAVWLALGIAIVVQIKKRAPSALARAGTLPPTQEN